MTEIYFNLHRKLFSIKEKGRVVGHAVTVILEDVAFKVSEAGRQRVLRTKKKNVHARACGTVVHVEPVWEHVGSEGEEATYNPYKYNSFVLVNTLAPVYTAKRVLLTGRKIYILIP